MNKTSINKTQIIKLVADKIEKQSLKEVSNVVNTLIEVITETLADNNQAVNIQGFITIENKLVKGRIGNFNNIAYKTYDRLVPKIKLSKSFIDKVAQNEN